ncbi:hypothetical protein FWG76_01660 [Candidatus Saccharibacteria bacterium]|nr:hypothetical protein [Candidatus Saccharibacteria bacterium]
MMKKFFETIRNQRWLVFLLIFVLMLGRGLINLDPDFGWHLKAGEHFRASGVEMVEPFTYTASDFPWVNHEAASDIGLSLIYDLGRMAGGEAGGYGLLAIVYAGLYTLAFFLIWAASGKKISSGVLLLGAIGILPFAGVRALTLSLLMLATLIWLLAKPERRLVFVPLLFLVWANLHGSFVVGLCYLAYRIFYDVVVGAFDGFSKRGWLMRIWRQVWLRRWWLAVLGVSLAATLVNFYGWQIYEEVFRTLRDPTLAENVIEWQKGVVPLATTPFLLVFLFGWLGAAKYPVSWLGQLLAVENIFFVAAFLAQRHWPLFVLAALATTSARLPYSAAKARQQTKDNPTLRWLVRSYLVCFGLLVGLVVVSQFWPSLNRTPYPKDAVSYLRENPCAGEIFNDYDVGGYLIWQLPGQKVYIDGRMPSWAWGGKNYLADYLRILEEASFRESEFAKYNVGCVIIREGSSAALELAEGGWQPKVKDGVFVLLVK